ncbi:MAG: hypothetical protein HYV14_16295 [Elusimicrobia bacterium]|nr:hypothetical protein [Elusimicrobiota bacterium]
MKTSKPALAAAVLCAAAAAWLFHPVLVHRFVNLEDYWLIADNPHLRALSWAELRWMFTSLDYGTYQPLGWLAYSVLHAWQGLNPSAYHLGSWLAHAACAALLFFTTLRILRAGFPVEKDGGRAAVLAAAAATVLWAWHPARVEPVAWATGLPDLLATVFFLAAVLAYLRPSASLCFGLFVVSSLFRWKGVSLPVVLVALDWFVLRRPLDRRARLEKVPFLLAAAAFGAVNARSKLLLAPGHAFDAGLHSLAGPVVYLLKLLSPFHLTVDYWVPRSPALAAAFVLLTAGAWAWRRGRPALFGAWLCFAAALLPSLVMSFRGAVVAHDRSTYLPAMSLHAALAAGLLLLLRSGPRARAAALAASAALAGGLAFLSRAQIPVWRDSESLWRHVLVEPAPPDYARLSLAHALLEQGRRDEAAAELREQLRLFPGDRRVEGLARELSRR